MILNTSVLAGENFNYVEEACIIIDRGRIQDVSEGHAHGGADYTDYITTPSFYNAHTHIGDSFAKDAVLGMTVSRAVGKSGVKWRLYEQSTRQQRIAAMRDTLAFMLSSGTTAFSDFREHGLTGIQELKLALGKSPVKSVILGRDVPESASDGWGLNLYNLKDLPKNRKKLLAVHAGERAGEVRRAFPYKPDVIIHFTTATTAEIKQAARNKISVVVCPRSNALLRAGSPNVRALLDAGVTVSLGTDNVMVSQPDMFREMAFLFETSHLQGKPLLPKEVFALATSNGAKTFGLKSGVVKKGMNANLLFIDKHAQSLRNSRNMLASVVHRCEPENVRKVMIDGRFVVNKDKK